MAGATPLSDAFCDHLVDATLSGAQIEPLLADIVASAHSAWPGLAVPDAEFMRYLAERLPAGLDPQDGLIRINTDDLYLACGCVLGDPAAARAFQAACLPVIRSAVCPDGVHQDEVVQAVMTKLLAPPTRLAEFGGRGGLRSWMRVVATRQALSMARVKKPEVPTDDALLDRLPDVECLDPELLHLKRRYREDFKAAFEEAFASLDAKSRNLLRQSLLDNLSIDQLGAIYRVHRATAARWLASARDQVLEETRSVLRRRLQIDEREFMSLMNLVRSQLDLSLARLLEDD